MPKTRKMPVITLQPVGATVRTDDDKSATFMDVTFRCGLTPATKGLACPVVILERHSIAWVIEELAERGYDKICKLVAAEEPAKKSKK
jgi:hypothetical protein